MKKILLLTIITSGLVFATQTENDHAGIKSDSSKYAFVEDTGQDELVPEGRRRGKGNRKRRRGGSGLK